jgi:hypothetical protein
MLWKTWKHRGCHSHKLVSIPRLQPGRPMTGGTESRENVMATLIGTEDGDTLIGGAAAERIFGRSGDDRIEAATAMTA